MLLGIIVKYVGVFVNLKYAAVGRRRRMQRSGCASLGCTVEGMVETVKGVSCDGERIRGSRGRRTARRRTHEARRRSE